MAKWPLLSLCLVELVRASGGPAAPPQLEIYPRRFALHPGERIHYQVLERADGEKARFAKAAFSSADPDVVRLVDPSGMFEAIRSGRTEIVVRAPDAERRVPLTVDGRAQTPIAAVPYSSVTEMAGKQLLFVGHANLDGFDHTAVAKPGIDRLVARAKKNGATVVYFVSKEYPDWYTADRQPDHAIVTEGQEHRIHVAAERVTFAGGSFMFCLLRNAQMTLHGMLERGSARRIDFVFPADAIWVEDIWGPGQKRPYPAPMVLVKTLMARRGNDRQMFDEVVVPFLDRLIDEYPVAGYPADAPGPALRELLTDWNIVVKFENRFERVYRRSESGKTMLLEFQRM